MVADEASGMSDGIRGLFAGFRTQTTPNGPLKGRIEYVTIATTGNSVEFDGILTIRDRHATACLSGNGSRGIIAGGHRNSPDTDFNIIDYITITTPSNAQDFGDLVVGREACAGVSDGVRGIIFGGTAGHPNPRKDEIDYITIATPANAADFGNLTTPRSCDAAASNGSRAVAAGGGLHPTGQHTAAIDYITIETPNNASDWGDLTQSRYHSSGFSGD